MNELKHEIESRLNGGSNLAHVESELIEPADHLSEDERAALWLYAWSYRASERERGMLAPASRPAIERILVS